MNAIKKLTASILIICLYLCLPESKAMASEAANDFIAAATSIDYPINDSKQDDCVGIYSIFSPCYTFQINIIDSNGDGSLDMYDTGSMDQTLLNDEDRILPGEDELEQFRVGFLISVVHF